VVPALIYDLDCTVFFGTNTFLNGYARKASPFDFRTLRLLSPPLKNCKEATAHNTWAQAIWSHPHPWKAYGATECSPCVHSQLLR